MYTQAQIVTAIDDLLGDVADLADEDEKIRWFNEGQARIGLYKHVTIVMDWVEQDVDAEFNDFGYAGRVHSVRAIEYPTWVTERRWQAVVGGIHLSDPEGADSDGEAHVVCRVYWASVDDVTPSELPLVGDTACISYAMHRFYRKLAANRSVYQRYATLVGSNGVSLDDLTAISDDHYRDYLELRADLADEPAATFYRAD
jgi:hypothetical protein